MNIYILALFLGALYVLLQFGIFPISSKKVSQTKSIRKKVIFLTINTLIHLICIGMVAFACLILVVFLIKLFSNVATANVTRHLIDFLSSINTVVSPLGKIVTIIVIVVSLILFLCLIFRQYTEEFKRKFEILFEQHKKGELEDIPYTLEMQKIQELINSKMKDILEDIEDYKRMFFAEIGEEELHNIIDRNTKKRFEHVENLKNKLLYLDIERRIDINESTTQKKKVNFFFSQGFSSTLSKFSNLATKISFIVFLFSFVIFQTHLTINMSEKDLSITYLKKNIEEIHKQIGTEKTPYTFTKSDEEILDEIAYDFEIAVSHNKFWDIKGLSEDSAYILKSLIVREQILKSFISTENDNSSKIISTKNFLLEHQNNDSYILSIQTELSNDDNDIPPLNLFSYKKHVSNTNTKVPQTELGETFKSQLKDIASKSEKHWNNIKTNFGQYKSSFRKPTSVKNIRSVMFSNLTTYIIDGESIARKVGSIIGSENVGLINENISANFLNDLIRNYDYLESLQKIQNMPAEEIFGSKNVAQQIKNVLPSVSDASVSKIIQNNPPALTASAKNTPEIIRSLEQNGIKSGELLTSYEDFFPGQMSSDTKTKRKKYEEKIREKYEIKKRKTPTQVNRSPRGLKNNFLRARNVKMLRGFSRVGGVLIGNMPTDTIKLHYIDIQWNNTKDNKIDIKLIDKDNEIDFVISKSIIKRALVYAADGRPTTVTMVNVNPYFPLKVLLHPALINSEVGSYAINVDRFVDTYTENENIIKKEREFANYQRIIYDRFVYYNNIVEAINNYQISYIEKIYLKNLKDSILNLYSNEELDRIVQIIQKEKLNFQNSVLVAKSYYFDQFFVDIMNNAKGNSFKTYMLDAFKKIDKNPISSNKQYNTYEIWSGVREKEYLLKNMNNRDMKSLFNFILQASIIIPEENNEFVMDEFPWQFPLLCKDDLINKTVSKNISSKDTISLQQMQEFCLAQRLFRLAFEGKFGNQFPIEKLIHLFNDVKNENDFEKTNNWSFYLPKNYFQDKTLNDLCYQLGIHKRYSINE